MGPIIAGSEEKVLERPFLSFNLGYMVSPLRFAQETTKSLTAAVREGIPVALVSAPLSGASTPTSLVDTLVQVIPEELAGLTFVQLLQPAQLALLGGIPLVADLHTGNMIGGSIELALMNAASAQMTQFYGLPVYNPCSITESKIPDIQTGFEKGMTTGVTALAGAQYNHHSVGKLESLLTVTYEQYVIDDDINGQIMRLVGGLEKTEETLSVEVIHDVCAGEGNYLGHDQAFSLMQTEYHYPHTAHRATRKDWEAAGEPVMRERARQRAYQTLKSFFPGIVAEVVDQQLRREINILLPLEVMQPEGYS